MYQTLPDQPAFDPAKPFNELPPLPPGVPLETPQVLKNVIKAREALAELKMACRLIPNPLVLTNTIPLREARASSEIENIVTTNDELFRAAWLVDQAPSPATKEAIRYKNALHEGIRALESRPLSIRTAELVCKSLQGGPSPIRSTPGTYIGDPQTSKRIYTPPEGRDVILDHLALWERFIYSDHGLDPIVLMAVTHYQFEAIHPFHDGNGRTGRILNILLLMQEELLTAPVLYLSGFIVENKSEYYRLLREVTSEGNWEAWVLFMVRAVESSARNALALINDLRDAQDEVADAIRGVGIGPAKDLAELLFINPYLRISNVVEAGLVKRQQATAWLNSLTEAGLLSDVKVGRERLFINDKALSVLTRA